MTTGEPRPISGRSPRLNREWTKGALRAHAIDEYYRASQVEFPQLLKARGYRPDELGGHAGLADTSLMLAIDPRLVRTSQMKPGRREDGRPGDEVGHEEETHLEGVSAEDVAHRERVVAEPHRRDSR